MLKQQFNTTPRLDRRHVVLQCLGALMLIHLALLAMLKLSRGIEGEMLWISHASLALGGLGLFIRSRDLVATAFVSVCALHTLWLFDAVVGNTTGSFPLNATTYATLSDWPTLLATSHHLYLAPVLGYAITRLGFRARTALFGAIILFAALTTTSRMILPPALNVNLAHAVLPASQIDLLLAHQALPAPFFLSAHLACATCLFIVPGVIVGIWIRARAEATLPDNAYMNDVHTQSVTSCDKPARGVRRSAFTLIELIAVIVVLSVLAGIAIPRYIDYTADANKSADEGELAGIRTALKTRYLQNRANDAPATDWIRSVSDIAGSMETGEIPRGISVVSNQLEDRRGNRYNLVAETDSSPARLTLVPSGGGGSS